MVGEIGTRRVWNRLLSPSEVGDWLGIPVSTLHDWRYQNKGPRAIRMGRHLRYRAQDVEAWIEAEADRQSVGHG
jgi:excisionase family DNA binding protein